jgi:hypothetical protein
LYNERGKYNTDEEIICRRGMMNVGVDGGRGKKNRRYGKWEIMGCKTR